MTDIYSRLAKKDWILPPELVLPSHVRLPFKMVRVTGKRAYISGHGPQEPDGSLIMKGKVGSDISDKQAYHAAHLTALSILGSLHRELGSLERITAWNRVFGMVNAAPGFNLLPTVINGFSDVVLHIFGDAIGAHSRSAVGMSELPFDIPVEIEAEVEFE